MSRLNLRLTVTMAQRLDGRSHVTHPDGVRSILKTGLSPGKVVSPNQRAESTLT